MKIEAFFCGKFEVGVENHTLIYRKHRESVFPILNLGRRVKEWSSDLKANLLIKPFRQPNSMEY